MRRAFLLAAAVAALVPSVALAAPRIDTAGAVRPLTCERAIEIDEWQAFCAAMQRVLTDRQPTTLDWRLPPTGQRRAPLPPLTLVEIWPQPVATTAKIVFRDIEMSIDGVGGIIAAADETVPDQFRTIDLELPAIFPDECPAKPNNDADLASVEIRRALVVHLTRAGGDTDRPPHCPPDPTSPALRLLTPALWVRGVTFKQSTRWVLPARPHVSLSFAATRFEGPLEIRAGDAMEAPAPNGRRRGATYIALSTSVFDGHALVFGIAVDEFTAYFNRMQSFELLDLKVTNRIKINDNAIGPLRVRGLDQPAEFIVDANSLSDSLYIEEVRPYSAADGEVKTPLWFVAHNKIVGNLKFSLVAGREAPRSPLGGDGRPSFRFMGMRIDGSAYLLVDERLLRSAYTFDLDLTHSTVASRLLVTAAIEADMDGLVGPTRHLHATSQLEPTACAPHRSASVAAKLRVDLTSSTAGALVWNLPLEGLTDDARCVGWSGPSFRWSTADFRPVTGPLLLEDGRSAEPDWLREAAQVSNWPQAQVTPSPEAYGFTERYFLDRGYLFEALGMKGRKTFENLSRKWDASIDDLRGGNAWDKASALTRVVVLTVLFLYYFPANYGANPEFAMLAFLTVWLAAAATYYGYGRRWARAGWSDYRLDWHNRGNRPFLAVAPGFEQKDEHPWRGFHHWLYSLDCMVPLVSLGVADEYQPHTQGEAGWRAIAMLPPAQKVLGTWLGTLCLVVFLF